MSIFVRKPHEKLQKECENFSMEAIIAVTNDSALPKEQKTMLLKLIASVGVLCGILVINITTPPFDFRRYVKKNPDVLFAFVGVCCTQLDRLRNKYPDITLLIPALSSLFGVDEKYFRNPLEEFKKLDIDPRDLWAEQHIQFYEFILTPEFDVRKYIWEDIGRRLLFSSCSNQIVIQGGKAFQESEEFLTK